jgi:flagellar assembly protein FliH
VHEVQEPRLLSNDVVLRGADAARARRIDLVVPQPDLDLERTGAFAAREEAVYEKARKEGFLQGRVEGYDQGRNEAADDLAGPAEAALAAVDTVRNELIHQFQEMMDRLAGEATNLALEIAESILEREIAVASDPGGDAIARCLALAPDVGDVVAHLHPDDLGLLTEVADLGDRDLQVVADPRLERGDAVVRVDDTLIDGRVARALERVAEVLR